MRESLERVIREGEDLLSSLYDGAIVTCSTLANYIAKVESLEQTYRAYAAQFPDDARELSQRINAVINEMVFVDSLGMVLHDHNN
jgi:hypothetical protein